VVGKKEKGFEEKEQDARSRGEKRNVLGREKSPFPKEKRKQKKLLRNEGNEKTTKPGDTASGGTRGEGGRAVREKKAPEKCEKKEGGAAEI